MRAKKQKEQELINELNKYKQAEAQGLLLWFPVPEGTPVYRIGHCSEICQNFILGCECCTPHKVAICEAFDRTMIEEFGKKLFLTEEEAFANEEGGN